MIKKIALLILVLNFSYNNIFSQNTKFLGSCLTSELIAIDQGFENGSGGFGISFELQKTKHSGFETGLYYRPFRQTGMGTQNGHISSILVAHRFLSIPILYKFYSDIINFSIGGTLDYYLGNKFINNSTDITDITFEKTMSPGIMITVSKSIKLSKKFILEPDVRFNPNVGFEMAYLGIGIKGKYEF